MASLIATRASEAPDGLALIDATGSRTWRELDERVDALIAGLRARGLEPGDAVAVISGNQRETVEVMLACLHAGWLLVPINWHWVARELAYVLEDAGAVAVVAGSEWADVAADAVAQLNEAAAPEVRLVAGAPDVPDGFEPYESVISDGATGEPGTEARRRHVLHVRHDRGSEGRTRNAR